MSEISEWRAVWMVVMFDLPVKTKRERHRSARFREFLKDDGFAMMQYSVYGRHCISREKAEAHAQRVRRATPPAGEVRILRVTEAQFARMEIYRNRALKEPESVQPMLDFW